MAAQAAVARRGSRVLDVGAGAGPYRELFAHCDYKAHDFAQEPGTIGRYTKLDYESDITEIPVQDGWFDTLLCTEVLEHVPDPIAAVREMARVLAPHGRLLITAPLSSHLHQEPFHYYGGYTPYWYEKVLCSEGFAIVSIERNQGFFSFFGQEALRFSLLINPRRTHRHASRLSLLALWLLTLPLCALLPIVSAWLDQLGLEQIATVGYHVVAVRTDPGDG